MLNQTLNKQTLRSILRLKSDSREDQKAIVSLLKAELNAVKDELTDVPIENVLILQGRAAQLKELIKLFETPEGFKGLFDE
tara:strand:- start:162 stop:404 length:243 start_codon:yes stop_codon:yes gene_type:complete